MRTRHKVLAQRVVQFTDARQTVKRSAHLGIAITTRKKRGKKLCVWIVNAHLCRIQGCQKLAKKNYEITSMR
jgi:hypothetical protein